MNPDILLLGVRNLAGPSGERHLIFNRATALHRRFGLSTLAISIVNARRLASRGEHKVNDYLMVTCIPTSIAGLPLAILRLLFEAFGILIRKRVKIVIISGSLLLTFIPLLRVIAPRTTILWDVHGVSEELIEGTNFSIQNRTVRLMLCRVQKLVERLLGNKADAALVVSREMATYLRDELGIVKQSFVVPCGVDLQAWPLTSEYAAIRKRIRSELSVGDNILFVYSGSLAPWQCFEQTVAFFARFCELDPAAKLLVLTSEVKKANQILERFCLPTASSRVLFVTAESLPLYLIAADAAFLLRKRNVTNRVASPNKFAEYLAAGLYIIIGEAVGDSSQLVLQEKLGMLLDPDRISVLSTEELLGIKGQLECEKENYALKRIRRALAERLFGWDRIINEMEPLFRKSLDRV